MPIDSLVSQLAINLIQQINGFGIKKNNNPLKIE